MKNNNMTARAFNTRHHAFKNFFRLDTHLPIVGVDAEGLIVAANAEADALFGGGLPLLGSFAEERLPAVVVAGLEASQADVVWTQDAQSRRVRFARLAQAGAQGRLIFVLD